LINGAESERESQRAVGRLFKPFEQANVALPGQVLVLKWRMVILAVHT
jgi:hypothetical protein